MNNENLITLRQIFDNGYIKTNFEDFSSFKTYLEKVLLLNQNEKKYYFKINRYSFFININENQIIKITFNNHYVLQIFINEFKEFIIDLT